MSIHRARWLLLAGLVAASLDLAPSPVEARPHHRRKKRRKAKRKVHREVERAPVVAEAKPAPAPSSSLLLPVQGVRPEQLQDTWDQSRSGGRRHDAIDIMAPRDTPVLAAIDGTVIKLARSERGGITVYQLGSDGATVYYYAHLDHYAEGLVEGATVKQGDLIAYVGDTGNAKPGNCHLHFAIWRVTDVKRYWEGENVNPYLLLRGGR